MSIRAVIFDLGNTLMRERGSDWEAGLRHVYALAEVPKSVTFEQYATAARELAADLHARRDRSDLEGHAHHFQRLLHGMLGLRFTAAPLEIEREFCRDALRLEPEPGAHETLAALRERGLRTGLLSNIAFTEAIVREKLGAAGLLELLDHVECTSSLGLRKPHPAVFLKTLNELDVDPEESLYVGDSLRFDVAGANAAGMLSVWYNPNGGSAEGDDVCPAHEIGRLGEVLALV